MEMRYLTKRGSLFFPCFNGESGSRLSDFDLSVGLGSHFDPRWKMIREMRITVPAFVPMNLWAAPRCQDPSVPRINRWHFDFTTREYEEQPTLCLTIKCEGDAQPPSAWGEEEDVSLRLYGVAREYAHRLR
jgi:hypothetical protein